jgi:hypothetical protein
VPILKGKMGAGQSRDDTDQGQECKAIKQES